MARKPKPKEHGSLTGSTRFQKSKSVAEHMVDGTKEAVGNVSSAVSGAKEAIGNAATSVQSRTTPIINATKPIIGAVGQATGMSNGASNRSQTGLNGSTGTNYVSPNTVNHGVQIPKFDINGAMGGLFDAESSVGEMGIKDATALRMTIARKENTLDVGIAKVKFQRKAVKLATELKLLEGDAVQLHTTGIQVSTKVVQNQIADVDYQTELSKLEQKRELFKQQQIATGATATLTPLIAEEWQIRIAQQQQKNESMKVDLERGQADMDIKRIEMEARLIEASNY